MQKWRAIFFSEHFLGQKKPSIWKWAKSKLWQVVILWCLTSTHIGPQWGQYLIKKYLNFILNFEKVPTNCNKLSLHFCILLKKYYQAVYVKTPCHHVLCQHVRKFNMNLLPLKCQEWTDLKHFGIKRKLLSSTFGK